MGKVEPLESLEGVFRASTNAAQDRLEARLRTVPTSVSSKSYWDYAKTLRTTHTVTLQGTRGKRRTPVTETVSVTVIGKGPPTLQDILQEAYGAGCYSVEARLIPGLEKVRPGYREAYDRLLAELTPKEDESERLEADRRKTLRQELHIALKNALKAAKDLGMEDGEEGLLCAYREMLVDDVHAL